MSCYLCKKKYSRVTQHMSKVHKIKGIHLMPESFDQYLFMLSVIPTHMDINQHLNSSPLPSDIYVKLVEDFKKYKESDLKICVMVGSNTKKK